jgi:hypothetical protein
MRLRQGILRRLPAVSLFAGMLAASALAGCGSNGHASENTAASTTPRALAAAGPSTRVANAKYTGRATQVCLRARRGVQLPRRFPHGAGMRLYAGRALVQAKRTQAGLAKLRPPADRHMAVENLLSAYGGLIGAYRQALAAHGADRRAARRLRAVERSVTVAADGAALPACHPAAL